MKLSNLYTDLVIKIKDIHVPHNATLASFDIKNLYTNIPISETITILQNKLKQNNTPAKLINEITETLNIITKQIRSTQCLQAKLLKLQ